MPFYLLCLFNIGFKMFKVWFIGVLLWVYRPFRQYFSLFQTVSKRKRPRKETDIRQTAITPLPQLLQAQKAFGISNKKVTISISVRQTRVSVFKFFRISTS